jgi:hypothetical protein
MDTRLHAAAAFLEQDDEQRAKAGRLASNGHPALRELAAVVASSGFGCEQEALHFLIPDLPMRLATIVRPG